MSKGRYDVKSIMMAAIIAALSVLIMIQSALARDLVESEREIISRAVMDQLPNPESARFKWIPFLVPEAEFYCGLVNSKNRQGEYTGDVPYFAYLTWRQKELETVFVTFIGDRDPESPETVQAWKYCQIFGYDTLTLAEEEISLAEEEFFDACGENLMESCEVDEQDGVREETCILVCCDEDDQCATFDSLNPR